MANDLTDLDRLAERTLPEFAPCFHGGAFFDAIGTEFADLSLRHEIINADVLDAWFPPAPAVLKAVRDDLAWLLRTSPPASADGLVRTIAQTRGLPPNCILPGAGSSDLIFLAFRQWLTPASRVLLLDPTYGEYAHVLEQVIGCQVERFALQREEAYAVDLERLGRSLEDSFDLLVLVNPNNPTGSCLPRSGLEAFLRRVPARTRVWLDEAYLDYVGPEESVESFAANSPNVVVCKSMSKVYALSGARAAYLCAAPDVVAELRSITPPWAVSLLAQIAAVKALQNPAYYAARYDETHHLRKWLEAELAQLPGWDILPGCANFVLCHLPEDGPDAATVMLPQARIISSRCRADGTAIGESCVAYCCQRAADAAAYARYTHRIRPLLILPIALVNPGQFRRNNRAFYESWRHFEFGQHSAGYGSNQSLGSH
jgi:histidinol-phosphate/aromatic aminotransferase/cobyric acid decarboxylase-like protein